MVAEENVVASRPQGHRRRSKLSLSKMRQNLPTQGQSQHTFCKGIEEEVSKRQVAGIEGCIISDLP